jgi:hypothetical protein
MTGKRVSSCLWSIPRRAQFLVALLADLRYSMPGNPKPRKGVYPPGRFPRVGDIIGSRV